MLNLFVDNPVTGRRVHVKGAGISMGAGANPFNVFDLSASFQDFPTQALGKVCQGSLRQSRESLKPSDFGGMAMVTRFALKAGVAPVMWVPFFAGHAGSELYIVLFDNILKAYLQTTAAPFMGVWNLLSVPTARAATAFIGGYVGATGGFIPVVTGDVSAEYGLFVTWVQSEGSIPGDA